VKGKRYKVAFSIVLFQCYFNQHIVFNSFKINTFSLITYPLTLSYRKQTPQQMKISPASATGFWNGLYFYGANFILMESTLFELYSKILQPYNFILQLRILPNFLVYLYHSLFSLLHNKLTVEAIFPIVEPSAHLLFPEYITRHPLLFLFPYFPF